MIDQLEPELRRRLRQSAQTVHPVTDLLGGAREQFRHQRARATMVTAGAAAAVVAVAVATPLALHHPGTAGNGVRVAQSIPASAPPSTATDDAAGLEVTLSGRTFTLPAGYEITDPATHTKLGPDERDVNDLTGYSDVLTASETGTTSRHIVIAIYGGDVGTGANIQLLQDKHPFGTDPHRRTTIAGHEASVSTVTDVPASTCVAKLGQEQADLAGEGCGAPLPHVTIEAEIAPDLHLRVSTEGISEDRAIELAASGLS